MDVAKSSGVSAYHIASRIKQEQGQKERALLFRVHIPDTKDIIIILILVQPEARRIRFIKWSVFCQEAGLEYKSKVHKRRSCKVGSNYINKGQNTLYFEKFNVVNTSSLYFHQYMGNATAALTEDRVWLKDIQTRIRLLYLKYQYTTICHRQQWASIKLAIPITICSRLR